MRVRTASSAVTLAGRSRVIDRSWSHVQVLAAWYVDSVARGVSSLERRQSKVVLLRARVGRPVGAQFRADEQTALARTSQTQTRGLQARISLKPKT